MQNKKHILVCCLNWGLGHATRCIPLIQNLNLEHNVSLASSGLAGELLLKNFPSLDYFELPDYNIQYSQKAFSFGLVKQIPKILRTIRQEKKTIALIQRTEQFDIIISDSRLGCWLPNIKSIYLCHQLNIQGIPFGDLANKMHRKTIEKFSEIWVPDIEGEKNLSGVLSSSTSSKVKRIGWISQFEGGANTNKEDEGKILAIVSGPEPHRTIFEKQLLEIQKSLPITIIGGSKKNIKAKDYIPMANRSELISELQTSDLIISRAGYTTLMDVICLGKKGILIPTPGQTEQEYLVKHNHNLKGIRFIQQDQLKVELIEEINTLTLEETEEFQSPNWKELLEDL
jgi:hypothetical protein